MNGNKITLIVKTIVKVMFKVHWGHQIYYPDTDFNTKCK